MFVLSLLTFLLVVLVAFPAIKPAQPAPKPRQLRTPLVCLDCGKRHLGKCQHPAAVWDKDGL